MDFLRDTPFFRAQNVGVGARVWGATPRPDTDDSGGGADQGGPYWRNPIIDDYRADNGDPPGGTPADGSTYIVPSNATGAWSGRETQIALYFSGTWYFDDPSFYGEGVTAYILNRDDLVSWVTVDDQSVGGIVPVDRSPGDSTISFWLPHDILDLANGRTGFTKVRETTATPPTPTLPDDYLVPYLIDSSATGDWAGHDGELAILVSTASGDEWVFITPSNGLIVWDETAGDFYYHDSGSWSLLLSSSGVTQEQVQDWVAPAFTGGVHVGGSFAYDDPNNRINFTLDDEYVEDLVGALIVGGTDIDVTYDDGAGTITITYTGSAGSGPTRENVEDWSAEMFVDGSHTGITVNYDDPNAEVDLAIDVEWLQDQIAAFLAAGSNISLTYNDAGNSLTIAAALTSGVDADESGLKVIRGVVSWASAVATGTTLAGSGFSHSGSLGSTPGSGPTITFTSAFSATPAVVATIRTSTANTATVPGTYTAIQTATLKITPSASNFTLAHYGMAQDPTSKVIAETTLSQLTMSFIAIGPA